jgi:Zn-dependent alcohol dehydrogenase
VTAVAQASLRSVKTAVMRSSRVTKRQERAAYPVTEPPRGGPVGPDFPAVIEAVRDGRLNPHALITDRISLEEAQEHGYEELLHHGDAHVKILVHP